MSATLVDGTGPGAGAAARGMRAAAIHRGKVKDGGTHSRKWAKQSDKYYRAQPE